MTGVCTSERNTLSRIKVMDSISKYNGFLQDITMHISLPEDYLPPRFLLMIDSDKKYDKPGD